MNKIFNKYHHFIKKGKIQIGLVIGFNLGFLISIFIKAFYFQGTSKLVELPMLTHYNRNMFIALFASIVVIFAIVWILAGRKVTITLLIVNFMISLLLFSDALYARHFDLPIGVYVAIFQAKFLGDIGGSVGSLLKIKDIVFFIDLPFWIYLYIISRKTKLPKTWKANLIRLSGAGVALIIACLVIGNCYGKTQSDMFKYRKDNVAREMGVFYFHYYDIRETIKNEVNKNRVVTMDEVELVKEMLATQVPNEYTGIAEGKNLIIIQLEAIQEFLIGATIEGQEVTPFLNKYLKESIYFENIYHQVGLGNTSDAEFLVNNSLHAAEAGANYYLYPFNKYYSLANILRSNYEYSTYVSHAFEQTFWNRNIFYQGQGFDEFYSLGDFEPNERRGWALGDKSFFKQSINKAIENSDGKPFYLFSVALSSHHPYSAFSDIDLDIGEFEGTMTGNYLRAAYYVDGAIEEAINHLKDIGVYEDTLIVIYGDHSGLFQPEAANLTKYLGVENNAYEIEKLQKVPLIINIGGTNLNMEIDNIAGQIDILPTIANLMNINMPVMLGRDLLGTKENFVVKRAGNVITDKFMYVNTTGKYYDMSTGEVMDDIDEAEIRELYKQLKASDLIVQKNLQERLEKIGRD